MTPIENALILFLCLMAGAFAGYWMFATQKINDLKRRITDAEAISLEKLRLTAYERLLIFCDRTSINQLVNKLNNPDVPATAMQQTMVQAIREEYEHNITQQLYVKPELWDAVTKMKEQNIFLINEIGKLLPREATALDLNKQLLQLIAQNEKATLNKTITEAIAYEVRHQLQPA